MTRGREFESWTLIILQLNLVGHVLIVFGFTFLEIIRIKKMLEGD